MILSGPGACEANLGNGFRLPSTEPHTPSTTHRVCATPLGYRFLDDLVELFLPASD